MPGEDKENRTKEAKQETTSNVHVTCRLKPGDKQNNFIKKLRDNKISIKDTKNDKEQIFGYDHLFDSNSSNDAIFDYVYEKGIQRQFDNNNCCLIALGQKSSGKSHTLFGVDSRMGQYDSGAKIINNTDSDGIIVKCFDKLLKSANELKETKEFQIYCSFIEVQKETVRDQLYKLQHSKEVRNQSQDENSSNQGTIDGEQKVGLEGLEVFENSNGVIMLKNLTQISITDPDELIACLSTGFQKRRENYQSLGYDNPNSHLIFSMNFILRDKENYNCPSQNSTIQFVEVCAPDRVSNTLRDDDKFYDNLCSNSQVSTQQKIIYGIHHNKKALPYKESKLTQVMQNYCNYNSEIIVQNHIYPNKKYFSDTLGYQQLVDKFKCLDRATSVMEDMMKVANEHKGEIVTNTLTNTEEKTIKAQRDDIMKLKAAFNYKKREYRNNMFEIGQLIGADEDLEKLIQRSNANFWKEFRDKKEKLQKIPGLDKVNQELEIKISRTKKKLEELQKEHDHKKQKFVASIYQLQDELRYYDDHLEIVDNASTDLRRQQIEKKLSDFKKYSEYNRLLLNEKSKAINKFPEKIVGFDQSDNTSNDRIKELAFNSQSYKNDTAIQKITVDHRILNENKKNEYETLQIQKNESIESLQQKCNLKVKKKKQEISSVRKEQFGLFELSKVQQRLIENVKNDKFGSGLESINIPVRETDKVQLINRESYKHLYKFLDRKTLAASMPGSIGITSIQTSKKNLIRISSNKKAPTDQSKRIAGQDSNINTIKDYVIKSQEIDDLKKTQEQTNERMKQSTLDKGIEVRHFDFENVKLINMQKGELMELAKSLKYELETMKAREGDIKSKMTDYVREGDNITEIVELLKEREYCKTLYLKEQDKNVQLKVVIDSQKRILSSKRN